MYNKRKKPFPCDCEMTDKPAFCPPPEKPPMPMKPPCPSVMEGMSLYESVNCLNDRVNAMCATYNDVMHNCYETLHCLEKTAKANGAYYNDCEVWTEEGYNANESATYTLIHKANVDQHGNPIRIQLHLAYGNTTNSQIKQDLFSASQITYADKIVTAIPLNEGGWYGNVFYQGAPIATSSQPTLYTVGFTRGGVMRWYPNTATVQQMTRDTIVDAMGCSGILIINGQIAEDAYFQNIPNYTEQTSRIVMGQNKETREVIFLVCGNENNVNKKGMTSKTCAEILLQYGCDTAVELTEGGNAGALDKGSMLFVPENNQVPNAYAFWYISRRCFYCNDFQYQIANLVQENGVIKWQGFLNKLNIEEVREDLSNEINNRIEADANLQNQITTSVTNLQEQINAEAKTRADADSNLQTQITEGITNLQAQINAEAETRANADTNLQEQLKAENDARVNADENLQNQITTNVNNLQQQINNEAEARNNAVENLQEQINNEAAIREDYDTNLQNQITKEIQDRTDADAVLHQEVLTEQGQRIAADKVLQSNINAEAEARAQADTQLQQNIDNEASERTQADNTLQSNINDLDAKITTCENNITSLQSLYNTLQQQMASLDTAVTAIQQTITDIETSLNNVKTSIEDIRSDINTINETLTKIQNGSVVLPYLPLKGGTMTGAINMGGMSITNVASPSAETDVVNKKYVDDAISGGITPPTGDYLPLTGGTMGGNIDMNNNRITSVGAPADENDAVNKSYVDTKTGNYLPLAGGTMSGNINVNNNKLQLSADTYVYYSADQQAVVIGAMMG